MNMKRFAVIVMAALGVLLATASRAQGDGTCNTTYTTFQTITGNLNVPKNATCSFAAGASVTGNTTVGDGATLFIIGGTVSGNVQGNNCGTVALVAVSVGGNVQIGNCRGTTSYPYGGIVELSTIHGDFQCHNNIVDQYACFLFISQVMGNVQVTNNVSSSSIASVIAGNAISKNLECQNNIPAPTNIGLLNTVTGNANQNSEGQCKGF
jgi:hypothetical protein